MFKKILIANRGEIACRVIKTARNMGIKTVAVYSDADRHALHVQMADEAYHIGPPPANQSYIVIDKIMEAIKATGAEAVHPGYGFLSENSKFAEALSAAGVAFIGPPVGAIEAMGDKITSKKIAQDAQVNTVPGYMGLIEDAEEAVKISNQIGYPVMIKASAGGGGKGMKVANSAEEMKSAFQTARAEGKSNFGNPDVYIEKYLTTPRHIEIQVFGDGKGKAVHLGERDCSLQRRHQKVFEEAPGPSIDAETRAKIGEICANAVADINYIGAGTIEFLYENGEFYFIEMNTRLQVEHPVTEGIFGVDLVREQILVAAGEDMTFGQDDLEINGHSIEVRINAERLPNFAPCPGKITQYHAPGGLGVRMDSALYDGYSIPPYYDSLIGKLIVHGRDRPEALARLSRALGELIVDGVDTTVPLFYALLAEQDILDGNYDIHWLEHWLETNLQG